MSEEFDFIGPNDLPALVAVSNPQALAAVKSTLVGNGLQSPCRRNPLQFETRYNQINYQVVVMEDIFAGNPLEENPSLQFLQRLPMAQRRYATIFLLGGAFETLNTLQAFAQSVHCVVNYTEIPMIGQLIQKTIAENNLFLNTFREIEHRVHQKFVIGYWGAGGPGIGRCGFGQPRRGNAGRWSARPGCKVYGRFPCGSTRRPA
jgi:hypothetical protein